MMRAPRISNQQYQAIQHRFLRYVKGYALPLTHRHNIVLKIKHSIRVEGEMEALSKGLGQDNGQTRLAKTIGLLHDIGRFEQYRRYETFSDGDSVDHGRFGVQIIQETDILAGVGENIRPIIEYAVSNHNQARLPEGGSDSGRFYAKLIRDADKLDIFRITCPKNGNRTKDFLAGIQHTVTQSTDISQGVAEAIGHHCIVDIKYVKSYSDLVLLRMAWVFDMNFLQTLKRFHQKKYLAAMRQVLPQNDLADKLYERIQGYVEQKIASAP